MRNKIEIKEKRIFHYNEDGTTKEINCMNKKSYVKVFKFHSLMLQLKKEYSSYGYTFGNCELSDLGFCFLFCVELEGTRGFTKAIQLIKTNEGDNLK